jgi:DNA repair photolyase
VSPSSGIGQDVLTLCEHTFVRWESLQAGGGRRSDRLPGIDADPVVRTFDAPEAMGIRFHEVEARSALNSVPPMSQVDFRWTINPYRGCTHACVYCFARPTHTYLDLNPRQDFEREIIVKVNLPEVLRAELKRPSWHGEHVALGTNTDPYQWCEGRYRITRGIWEQLLAARNPCSVLTKSPLLLRDLDLLKELARRTEFAANLSIPTLDEKAWRASEPATPHPRKRIEALAELRAAGIEAGVLIAPLMPGINDSPQQVNEILELCGEAGATSIGGVALHLRGEVREIFLDWLRQYRPDLLPRYELLYRGRNRMPSGERRRLASLVRRGSTAAGFARRPRAAGGEEGQRAPAARADRPAAGSLGIPQRLF